MSRQWTMGDIQQLTTGYQAACVLMAAGELDLFSTLAGGSFSAEDAAGKLQADPRALRVLLDALTALELLEKTGHRYTVPRDVASILGGQERGSFLAMVQHQAGCLRRWAQLAKTVKTGQPASREPSIRGESADYASFIEAMDNISAPAAPQVVADLQPLNFHHLLDIGGASGTWTLAFLRTQPSATATIFDLPHVIPQARQRIAASGMAPRIKLVGGDYLVDPLPTGADLAWISAIVHSNSPQENHLLLKRTFEALAPGGRVLIRDFVMDSSRTQPLGGAMFAINMLTGTPAGGTFTFDELRADLESVGFTNVAMARSENTMNAVLEATKPAAG